jgi:endoglucanase
MTLYLKRGVNIEGWLWDYETAEKRSTLAFEPKDAERLAQLGFDHIRINVDEQHFWDEAGAPRRRVFDMVDGLLDTCAKLQLSAVLDLHTLRSHHFNAPERLLFTDPACVDAFLDCWRKLSAHFGSRPNAMLAYEFMNEPVADDPQDWNRVSTKVHGLLRSLEPERTLVLGSNGWSGPNSFPELAVPEDSNLVLTFHYYQPFLLTHYAVSPKTNAAYRGQIHYPGCPIATEDFDALSPPDREALRPGNVHYDRDVIAAEMRPALDVAARHDLPLYCGEWGCYDTVPRDVRLRWHRDMVSVLSDLGIGWAAYAHAGRWGVVRNDLHEMDTELSDILLGVEQS